MGVESLYQDNHMQLSQLQRACTKHFSNLYDGFVGSCRRTVEDMRCKWEDDITTLRENGLMVNFYAAEENDKTRLLVIASDTRTDTIVYPKRLQGQSQADFNRLNYYQLG